MTGLLTGMMMPLLRAVAIVSILATFSVVAAALQLVGNRRGARLADRSAVLFCRSMLCLLGVRLRIEGAPATTPALIVANHVSWIDILAFGSRPSTCFLAKAEVARWPVIARFARLKGTVFVERRHRRSIIPANAGIAARLQDGRSVVVFPEGTTGDGTIVGRFGSSHVESVIAAHRAGADVLLQPVALAYDHPRAAWIGDESLLPHLMSILLLGSIECTLAFAAPIAVDSTTSRKPLTQMARDIVAAEVLRLQKLQHPHSKEHIEVGHARLRHLSMLMSGKPDMSTPLDPRGLQTAASRDRLVVRDASFGGSSP